MPLTVVRREHHHLYSRLPRSADAQRAVDALLRLQHAEELQIEHARTESSSPSGTCSRRTGTSERWGRRTWR